MDTLILGTGSADGWPTPFCDCASCTRSRTDGVLRGQTSVLVDGRLLLDCGPETPRAAERLGASLRALRHVLLTHQHPDHCAPAFLLYRSWAGDGPLDVIGPPEAVDACRAWVSPESPVRFVPVAAGDRVRLGEYHVRVLAASHGPPGSSVLYDVATPWARLLYATDTGPLPEETVTALRDTSLGLVLLEETFGDRTTHGTDHLDLPAFAEQLRRLREVQAVVADTTVVAVHLSHHNPPTPELERRLAAWNARPGRDGERIDAGARAGRDGERIDAERVDVDAAAPTLSPRPADPAQGALRTLVLGGARSGKSREAEQILAAAPEVIYVATSYPTGTDAEWDERVRRHQADRPGHWTTLETLDLVGLLGEPGAPLLVDCLTLWLTRVMDRHGAWDEATWAVSGQKAVAQEMDDLVAAWRRTRRRVVAVSNEVGQGVVPDTASGRRFRDLMGRLNARVAAETEDVRWCVAGRVTSL